MVTVGSLSQTALFIVLTVSGVGIPERWHTHLLGSVFDSVSAVSHMSAPKTQFADPE